MSTPQSSPLQPQPMPPFGGPAPAPAPPRRSKAPKVLMIIGGIILGLAAAVGITIAIVSILRITGDAEQIIEHPEGAATITAEEGELVVLYVQEGAGQPYCTVGGPAPDSVGTGTSVNYSYEGGGDRWVSFDSFTAEDAGDYSIDCGGTPFAAGPPVSIGAILGTVGGILTAVLGGGLGLLLLIIGLILWLVGRSRSSAA